MHISWVFQILKWSESRSVMPDSLQSHGLYSPWNFPGQNTGVGSLSLLQIFPTQGLNPGLPHCGQILYQLSHQGSTDIWAISWAISYQGSLDAKTTTKWKKLIPRWSWACSPQTYWPLRIDHPQSIRESWLSWAHTLRHPSLSWPLKRLCWNSLRSSGCLGHEPPLSLAQSCNKPFSASNFKFVWPHSASDTWT